MQQMISPGEALEIVLRHTPQLESEKVAHAAALARTLSRDIVAPFALPPFHNSAMDGYAVRAADLRAASAENPVALRVRGTIAAGGENVEVTSGNCARIMTGAPLPAGADAVVMREEVREECDIACFEAAAPAGDFVRRAGSDVERGETVMRRGEIIGGAAWGMLASLDFAQIDVVRRPRVALLVTGDELTSFANPLQPGHIRDSNSYTLRAALEECGAICEYSRTVPDDATELRAHLEEAAAHCDFIFTSGGVSAGDFDLVRDVLLEDAQVHFWKMRIKPGKPAMFATRVLTRESGDIATPILALPGNPVSSLVVFELLARPALLRMQARRTLQRPQIPVRVESDFSSPRGKTEFVRARVRHDEHGFVAALCGDQASGRLSSMLGANALLVVPENTTEVIAGATLTAHLQSLPEED
jgi:molybdopterin molybdotransferase